MKVDLKVLQAAGINPASLYYAARILAGNTPMPAQPDKDLSKTLQWIKTQGEGEPHD